MKKYALVAAALMTAVTLSACGSSPAARKASLDAYVSSLGAQPNLQIKATSGFTSSAPGTAKVHTILGALSYTINMSSTTGQSIAQSSHAINVETVVAVRGKTLFDMRAIGKNVYFKLNLNQVANIPDTNVPAGEIAAMQLFLGGRWFEITPSSISGYVPPTDSSKTNTVQDRKDAAMVLDALTNYIDSLPFKNPSSGTYTVHDTLQNFLTALLPTLQKLYPSYQGPSTPAPSNATYTMSISASGTGATGATLSISAPTGNSASSPLGTAIVTANFTHANQPVTAPANATVVTKSLIAQLFSSADGGSSGSF
jgi:hypothetical protein